MAPTFDPTPGEDAREERAREAQEALHPVGVPRDSSLHPMNHAPRCPMRLALETSVGIECRHGYDVCPECDPCECRGPTMPEGARIEGTIVVEIEADWKACAACGRLAPLVDDECPDCRR